jgi:hypothetical protein
VPERLNWASIEVGDEVVVLPWQTRDELLDRARPLEPLRGLRRKIELAGATRLAVVDEEELPPLFALVQVWIDQTTVDNFTDSLFTLRNAIAAEFAARGVE